MVYKIWAGIDAGNGNPNLKELFFIEASSKMNALKKAKASAKKLVLVTINSVDSLLSVDID